MKISVLGSINMDMTVKVERIPLKGETLKGESISYIPGGKGANQAVAMARLGAEVEMFGCVGKDANGEILIKNLNQNGVVTKNIKRVEGAYTGIATITVGENDNAIVVVAGANEKVDCDYIDTIKEDLLNSELVVLQHEIPLETVKYAIDICYEKGVKILLNPAPAYALNEELINKVTYITPNEHEAKIIFGGNNKLEDLLRKYKEKLIVTLGEKGVVCCLSDGNILQVPCRKSNVVDTTGAGDTLNGALAAQIAEGVSLKKALRFANIAAGMSVEKFGAQNGMPCRAEVEKEFR